MNLRQSLLVLSTFRVLTSCTCDKDNLPQYTLTADELSWRTPYQENAEWRFRNAGGYERTYRVVQRNEEMTGGGGGKSSFCASYQRQDFNARLQRTDSTLARTGSYEFIMQAKVSESLPFAGSMAWNSVQFTVAIDRLQYGSNIGNNCEVLPQLTVGSKTYQHVLKSTSLTGSALTPLPTDAKVIYLTSEAGLIRWEEWGGTVWERQ